VVWDPVLKAEPAEPTIGQVDLDLATQRTLRADREGVTNDQHPDHQHRINRWPPQRGVVGCKLGMDPRQVQNSRNPPDLMITRNGLLEVEAIEQLPLVPIEPPHHRPISQKSRVTATELRFGGRRQTPFATESARIGSHGRRLRRLLFGVELPPAPTVTLAVGSHGPWRPVLKGVLPTRLPSGMTHFDPEPPSAVRISRVARMLSDHPVGARYLSAPPRHRRRRRHENLVLARLRPLTWRLTVQC
jgi:hypothetical protein